MGILSVTETFRDRGGSRNAEGVTEWVRSFLVRCDNTDDTVDTIIAAQDPNTGEFIPRIGDPYLPAPNVNAGCVRLRPKQGVENPFHWEVDAEYSTTYIPGAENPLTRPIRLRKDSVPYKEPLVAAPPVTVVAGAPVVGANATAVLNSASMPFDPPPERDTNYSRYTIVRFEDVCPDDNIRKYENTVNADSFRGWGSICCRMTSITYEAVWINGAWYYETTYVIDAKLFPPTGTAPLNVGGWIFSPVDAGYQEIVSDGAGGHTWAEIKDATGRQPSSPWLLDGNGSRQPAPAPGSPGAPIYLSWCPYPLVDWDPLVVPGGLDCNSLVSLAGPP